MDFEEFDSAMRSGEHAEQVEVWAPRAAAILITLTTHAPQLLHDDPERVLDILRQLTAKMPVEVLVAATMGLVEVHKLASMPGMTPELYEDIQSAFPEDLNEDQ